MTVFCLLQFFSLQISQAQFIPLPPPGPDSQPTQTKQAGEYDPIPPVIEFLTISLKQGKNVFKIKVLDDAPIDYVLIKQVINQKVISDKMLADPNNIYKSLVTVDSPSKVIVISALDMNGNYTEAVKKFDIQTSPDVFDSIKSFFNEIFPPIK